MPTLGTSGIFFDEMPDSPKFNVDIAAARITFTQVGVGNWLDIDAMYAYLMAPTLVFGEIFGVFAGAAYPGNSNIRCIKAQAEPLTDDITGPNQFGVNLHNLCKWTIVYSNIMVHPTQQQTQDPVAMLTHEWDIGGEFITPSNLAVKWAGQAGDDSVASGDAKGGIVIPTQEVHITWPRLPDGSAPFQAIRALAGKVNNADLTFDTGVMKFETALFLGARVKRDSMSDGNLAWSLTYKFSQKQVVAADNGVVYGGDIGTQGTIGGWNHFFRNSPTSKIGFWRLRLGQAVQGSKNIYQHGNFKLLFQADQPVSEAGT